MESYTNFEKIAKNNRKIAEKTLSKLKTRAFLTGFVPALDAGMKTSYRDSFIEKMENIYGFTAEDEQYQIIKDSKENLINEINLNVTNLGENLDESIRTCSQRSFGTKVKDVLGWVFLPITYIPAGIWASNSISKEGEQIISYFESIFPKYKYEAIINYVNTFEKAIKFFEELKKKYIANTKTKEY